MVQYQVHKGQKLGNYVIDDFLGRGGFANVYLASHVHFGEKVAIKVLNERGLQETELEQFLEEGRKLRGLKHDNIIKILDCGVETDPSHPGSSILYLVMDYAPLGPISRFYRRETRLPLAVVIQYVKQIASALQCAHDHHPPIVHLDVKPANILLMKEDQAVLSDFGIAVSGMVTENLQYQKDWLAERQARKEQILFRGTPTYMAPEYWQGHTQRATDQYALGIMAYEWLCGCQPFTGTSDEIRQQHALTQPPSFWRKFPDIPLEVEHVVMTALAKKPEDRYKRIMDFALALEKAAKPVIRPSMVYDNMVPPPVPPASPWASTVYPKPDSQSPTRPAGPPQQQMWLGQPSDAQSPPQQNQATFDLRSRTWGTVPPDQGMVTPSANTVMDDVRGSLKAAQKFVQCVLITDNYFLRTYRNRRFFFSDILINLLLTLSVLFTSGIWLWLFGMLVSYCLLWYCTLAVKKVVAILSGAGIAIWWGYAVSSLIDTRFHATRMTLLSLFLFLLLGLGIHAWYVLNRIKE